MEPYNILLAQIQQGILPVGNRIPSERQLAEDLQVTRSSIRRAISRLVTEGWVEARPGFRPVVRARPAVVSQNKAVALLIGGVNTYPPYSQILRGCEQQLRRHGYLLVFMDTSPGKLDEQADCGSRELETLRFLSEKTVQGVILWCQAPDTVLEPLELLRSRGIDVVTIDREVPGAQVDHIGVDNFRAACSVVEYLYQAGHQRIVFATSHSDYVSSVKVREEGFLHAMHKAGLDASERSILRFPNSATIEQMSLQLQTLKSDGQLPTAFFAMNNWFAYRLIYALRGMAVRIPEDVSVVGFDGIEPSFTDESFLTTVHQPFFEIGGEAVRALLQRFEEPSLVTRQILLPTSLIEYASVRKLRSYSG